VGFIVASNCEYLTPIKFPSTIHAGMRVNKIGDRSAEYGIGIFCENNNTTSAYGTFTHAFVNRKTGRSTSIPQELRSALCQLLVE